MGVGGVPTGAHHQGSGHGHGHGHGHGVGSRFGFGFGFGSEDANSESDSNPSLAGALAALRRKRHKFATRNSRAAHLHDNEEMSGGSASGSLCGHGPPSSAPPMIPSAPSASLMEGGALGSLQSGPSSANPAATRKVLQRASSVPTRTPDDAIEAVAAAAALTPSTTEESVSGAGAGAGGLSDAVVLAELPAGATPPPPPPPAPGEAVTSRWYKNRNGMVTTLPSLPPGIQPVSGHDVSAGWL